MKLTTRMIRGTEKAERKEHASTSRIETLEASHVALLEALLSVREWAEKSGQYDKMDKVYSQMQAAIAKAKG